MLRGGLGFEDEAEDDHVKNFADLQSYKLAHSYSTLHGFGRRKSLSAEDGKAFRTDDIRAVDSSRRVATFGGDQIWHGVRELLCNSAWRSSPCKCLRSCGTIAGPELSSTVSGAANPCIIDLRTLRLLGVRLEHFFRWKWLNSSSSVNLWAYVSS